MTELEPRTDIAAACAVVIAAAVVVALRWAGRPPALPAACRGASPPAGAPAAERRCSPRAVVPANATEEYGRRLIAHTAELLGQDQPDPERALHQTAG